MFIPCFTFAPLSHSLQQNNCGSPVLQVILIILISTTVLCLGCNISPSIISVIHSSRVTMAFILDSLKLAFWIGLPVYGK